MGRGISSDRVRPARRRAVLGCEALEGRVVAAAGVAGPVLGQITGAVTNSSTGGPISHVRLELINSASKIVATTTSNAQGNYAFDITRNGPYVVREVVPRGRFQVSPSFATTAPAGAYAPGAGNTSWSYIASNTNPAVGPVGPAYWSDIAPAGAEPFESPINLNNRVINLNSVLRLNFPTSRPTDIINNSHQIQIQYTSPYPDSITAGGTQYNLSQFHYHAPSETTVNGRRYPLEEHFVALSASGAESVVAVFFRVGARNAALQPILDAASTSLTAPNSTTRAPVTIDFAGLLPKNPSGWFYRGSLTTPPLSQAVNWFVYRTPVTLSQAQLGQYEAVASGAGFLPNARPTQALDGRILNEVDNDINFTGTTVGGQSFSLTA